MTASTSTSVASAAATHRHDNPSRVLWLAKGLGLGGAEQLVRTCIPRFDPARFEIEVGYVLAHKDALVPAIEATGVRVVCLGDDRPAAWPLRLARLLWTRRYALVHTHSPVLAAAARLVAPPGTILVHTEHNVWARYRLPTRAVNAATFGRNAFVFAVSQAVASSTSGRRWLPGPPRVEVLHHGIDESEVRSGEEARAEARGRLGLPPRAAVIGTVANLTPKKDHETLLRAVQRLSRSGTPVRAVLVGDGPLRAHLESMVRDLGIADAVLFTGSRHDVPEIVPAFDVFVLTSLHEGLPIALLEAMAAGVPAVVTPVGGTRDMMSEGREGHFVPCRDDARLADVLTELLADPATRARMGEAAQLAARRFSIQGAVDRMQDVYAEVLTGPDAGRT